MFKRRRFKLFIFVIILLTIYFNHEKLINFNLKFVQHTPSYLLNEAVGSDLKTFNRKWIVITSIYKTTEAIKAFSQMPGWQLLVVGDLKSPPEWNHDNTIYLGVEEQKRLPYSIARCIPWNSYTRKMIGYLYAIQHGAEYIYESDDDNVPNHNLSLFHQSYPYRLVSLTKNLTFNPYAHFGQPSIWPRGYPLDRIGMPHPNDYVICPTQPPTVAQSLVNGDPDVDAIYRLTRLHSTAGLNISFDPKAPLYLNPPGTFSPFNSQNTLYHRNVFWGLLLPTSVSDRATDIFRSYWTQRLMWLVGQHLAFEPANFYQKRFGHIFLDDFEKEVTLYKEVGNFIKLLKSWECSSKLFEECILNLTKVVIGGGFWKESDYNLVQSWLYDLNRIDKSLLSFEITQVVDPCISDKKYFLVFHPEEQVTSMNNNPKNILLPYLTNEDAVLEHVYHYCGSSIVKSWNSENSKKSPLQNIVLVVGIYGDIELSLPAYETFYGTQFYKIIYCVDKGISKTFLDKWKASMIFLKTGELSAISCLSAVTLMNINATGFLHLSDRTYMNITFEWKEKDFKKVWFPEQRIISTDKHMAKLCGFQANSCKHFTLTTFHNILKKNSFSIKLKNILEKSLWEMQYLFHSDKLSMVIDIPLYISKSKVLNWYRTSSHASKSYAPVEFLTWLFLELYGAKAFKLRLVPPNATSTGSQFQIISSLGKEFCGYL